MAACHILQEEVYPSQIVDDTLDTSLAATSATLEEDLNYIRSVLKAIHGGTTWYDVGTGIVELLSDFPVEHYTTSENPAKAGQHKDIHADSLTTPTATIDTSIIFSTTNYSVLNENTGPDGQAGTRLWIAGPNDASGAATGIVFGPQGANEYFNNFRIKAGRLDFETNSGYLSIQTDASTGPFLKVLSTAINKNFEVTLSDTEISILPRVNTLYQAGEFKYVYTDDAWKTPKFKATNATAASLASSDHALEVGNIAGGSGLKLGANVIAAVQNTNQPERLLLNPGGISEVVTWSGVTATNLFPLRVGSEGYGVWHEGNQGHGSGLDADTVDGKHAADLGNLGGSIRASSPNYSLYRVATISPIDPLPGRDEPYSTHIEFSVRYRLEKYLYTFWLKFAVDIVYERYSSSSSNNWKVASMSAVALDGTFEAVSPDLLLIHGTHILLQKRTITVNGDPQDVVDVILHTTATELDIYETTHAANFSLSSPVVNPTNITYYNATTAYSPTCTYDTCVTGKHKYTLVRRLGFRRTSILPRGDGIIRVFGQVYQTAHDSTSLYIINGYTGDNFPLEGVPMSNVLFFDGTNLDSTKGTFWGISIESSTAVRLHVGFLDHYTSYGPSAGAYQHISGDPQTVSIGRMQAYRGTTYHIDNAAFRGIASGFAGNASLPRAFQVQDIRGVFTAETSIAVGSGTSKRLGGYIPSSPDSSSGEYYIYELNITGSGLYFLKNTSTYLFSNEAYYHSVVSMGLSTAGKIIQTTLTCASNSPYAPSGTITEYTLPFVVEPNSAVHFFGFAQSDQVVLAYRDSSNAHLKIAFINNFSSASSIALEGLDLNPTCFASVSDKYWAINAIYTTRDPFGQEYVHIHATLTCYYKMYRYIITAKVDGLTTNWEWTITELPTDATWADVGYAPTYSANWTYNKEFTLIESGKMFIPIGFLTHMAFAPEFAALDKSDLSGHTGRGRNNRGTTTLQVTQGSLGDTITQSSDLSLSIAEAHAAQSTVSQHEQHVEWGKEYIQLVDFT